MIKTIAVAVASLALLGCNGEEASCTFLSSEDVRRAFEETKVCMGMDATIPVVEYESFQHYGLPPGEGLYWYFDNSVWLNGDLSTTCKRQEAVLKHEYVHHILTVNGYDNESKQHNHVAFASCGAIVGDI